MDIPDQVLHAEPCSGQQQLRIMDQNHIVILSGHPHDRAGRLPGAEAASASRPRASSGSADGRDSGRVARIGGTSRPNARNGAAYVTCQPAAIKASI